MSFDGDDLSSQSYEIVSELVIRGILEQQTEWQYEFTKNSKYDYDLQLFDWGEEPDGPSDRNLIGYVEIEVTNEDSAWQTGSFPDNWDTTNVLARKVYQYDNCSRQFGGLKHDAWRTIYLKFNHEIDNCFAIPIDEVDRAVEHRGAELNTWRGEGRYKKRNWTFIELVPSDEQLVYGIADAVELIIEHLSHVAEYGREVSLTNFAHTAGGGSDE